MVSRKPFSRDPLHRRPSKDRTIVILGRSFWQTEFTHGFWPREAHTRPAANSTSRRCRRHLVFGAVVRDIRACSHFGARRSLRAGSVARKWLVVCEARNASRAFRRSRLSLVYGGASGQAWRE